MTLPDERYRSIQRAELLLRQLCDPGITPRVPKYVRREAAAVLRHYPSSWDLKQLELVAPHVVQERMEPLHKWVLANDSNTVDRAAQQLGADDHEGSTQD